MVKIKIDPKLPVTFLIIVGLINLFYFMNCKCSYKFPDFHGEEFDIDDFATASTGAVFQGLRIREFDSSKLKTNTGLNSNEDVSISVNFTKVACKNWSVVTTAFDPSESFGGKNTLGYNWCLLIVAHVKSSSKAEYLQRLRSQSTPSQVIYLDEEDQNVLAKRFRIVENLPWSSFARKNIGYLFALMHGAEAIWDFSNNYKLVSSSGNVLTTLLVNPQVEVFEPSSSIQSLALNPYSFFASTGDLVWPRGFPLSEINNKKASFQSNENEFKSHLTKIETNEIGVVQSLSNFEPDVDAFYKMTRSFPLHFDAAPKPAFLLPKNAFSPFNSKATLVRSSSLWMLYLPVTVTESVSDVWRSYIAQALARDTTGQRVLYVAPLVEKSELSQNFQVDVEAELDLYLKTNSLLQFLKDWKPSSEEFPERMTELYIELYERNYIQENDVILMHCWVEALKKLNFKFPVLVDDRHPKPSNANCPQKWPHLELFLPADYIHFQKEFSTFLTAFYLFWPHHAANLLLLVDSESREKTQLTKDFLSRTTFTNSSRVALNDPSPNYNGIGHNRQQLLMFWADNFTSAEYVGFADTDTIFTSIVDVQDVFVDGKPVVIGMYVKEKTSGFWTRVSKTTAWILGKEEVMKCMTYFPVVVKTEHLRDMRSYFVRLHGASSFNDVYRQLLLKSGTMRSYSQFNIICNYMWYFKRNEYDWHIHESSGTTTWSDVPGRVKNPRTVEGVTSEMFAPVPRIAIHGYRRSETWLKDAVRTSVCFALSDFSVGITGGFKPSCSKYLQNKSYHPLFFNDFEIIPTDWTWHPGVVKADHERKERMRSSGCFPQWTEEYIRTIFAEKKS